MILEFYLAFVVYQSQAMTVVDNMSHEQCIQLKEQLEADKSYKVNCIKISRKFEMLDDLDA